MRQSTFDRRLPENVRTKVSLGTLSIWRAIHNYIVRHRQTDAFDADLQKALSDSLGKWISDSALRRHFKRMVDAGLLEAHGIIVRYSDLGKVWLAAGFAYRGGGEEPPPGRFLRYTLPGQEPSLHYNSDRRKKRKG
jgi:hypothetical protein